MGLFHDVCVCGHKVSKRARFCPKCGRGAPNGWVKCPSCRKWVGNESEYCPHCNHPLHPAERLDLAGGVWDREPGLFAQRFELGDVSRVMRDGLQIQEGTVAILLDGGRETKVLGPGRHEPQGALRTLNWFGNPPPRTAVMVESGDAVFRVDFTGRGGEGDAASAPLRSAEELEVSAVAEVTLRFVPGRADAFMANFMKDQRTVTGKDVCALLYEEALSAVRDLCLQSTIEDLVKDPDRRERFEDAIGRALQEPLARNGLELVRVGAVEFHGRAYEEMRERYGELEAKRRQLEYEKKVLELLADKNRMDSSARMAHDATAADEKMEGARRVQEVEDYLAQLAQEKQLAEIDRTKETEIAVRVAKGEVSREDAVQAAARTLERHAAELKEQAHGLEMDLVLKNYNREQLVLDAENQARLAAIQRSENEKNAQSAVVIAADRVKLAHAEAEIKTAGVDAEIHEADRWLDIRAKKDALKNKELRERAATLAGKSELELAALAGGDADARDAFLKHAEAKLRLETDRALTPEQHLARQAGESAAAASALAAMAASGEHAAQRILDELKAADKERHEHDDKILDKMSELAKEAIRHQNNTTVVPPQPTNIVH